MRDALEWIFIICLFSACIAITTGEGLCVTVDGTKHCVSVNEGAK